MRAVSAYPFRCEGVDASHVASGHRDTINHRAWFLRHAVLADDGEVVWQRACAACGLAIIARSSEATLYVPQLPRRNDAGSRIEEARDKLSRCRGERRLLAELLRVAFKDLESVHRRESALAWFEGEYGRFTVAQVARYLALDAESLRRAAERVCSKNGSG